MLRFRRASLRFRLLLAASAIIVAHALIAMVVDMRTARDQAHRQQTELGAWVVSSLGESLANALVVNDLATVQSTVKRLFSGKRFLQLAVLDEHERVIIDLRAEDDSRPKVPAWFADLLRIRESPSRQKLQIGGVEYGVVVALISPTAAIEHAWAEVQESAITAAVAIIAFWLLFKILIDLGMRPLAELSDTVHRIGLGDFTVRAADRGVPEFRELVRVINLMTQRLAELVERTREQAASEIQARRLKDFHSITTTDGDSADKIAALLAMGLRHFDMEAAGLVAAAASGEVRPVVAQGRCDSEGLSPLGARLCRLVGEQGAPLALYDVRNSPFGDDAGAATIAAFLAAPVAFAGRRYGVVYFWRSTPAAAPVLAADAEFANLVGQWIGLAMEQDRNERMLWEEKERLQVTLASIGDAVVATDTGGRITFLNAVAETIIGAPLDAARGHGLDELCALVHEQTREPIANPIRDCLERKCRVELAAHGVLVRPDGVEYPIEDSAAPILDRQGEIVGAVMVFRDVTEARYVANQLEHLASHDPLTNLPNRRGFESTLARVLTGAKLGSNKTHGLCFIDLDHFKAVNDTCGHAAGDELLRQLAALLTENLRGTDVLARLGGDEFGLILAHITPEQALDTAERMCKAVRDFRFHWDGQVFRVGASIGLATVDPTAQSADELIRQADAACYRAKHGGRDQVCRYDPAERNDAASPAAVASA